jgi:hypothetical protein
MSDQHGAKALPERISPHGTIFDAATLLDFVRSGLCHSAVSDEVTQLMDDHMVCGRTTPMGLSQKLHPILLEPLTTMTDEDWLQVARDLIADTESVLDVRPLGEMPGESDEQLAADLLRRIATSSQTAEELLGRARELRAEAAHQDVYGLRKTAFALADRYELAAKRKLSI